ncbi:MAG: CPBP family glutamic-type intramembrane protease, partial [Bacteroidota bacterium]
WGQKWSETAIIAATACLFAIIHYPSLWLIAATFLLAIVYTVLYLRGSNLLVLGIYHGWLGGVFFYTILGRNPWLEAFG